MSVKLRGRPCARCTATPPRAATHHGMCARCWLGASESQRRGALLDELATPDPLEEQFALLAVEPERRRAA